MKKQNKKKTRRGRATALPFIFVICYLEYKCLFMNIDIQNN